MLSIRLARIGTKNKPFYRLILCEKGRDNYGNNLEILGTYNSYTKELKIEEEKIKSWMAKGAKLSATLNNLFLDKKIITGVKKQKSRRLNTEKILKKREDVKKKEADAKAAAEAAAAKAAEEAAAAKAAEAAAAAETAAAPAPVAEAETPTETPVV